MPTLMLSLPDQLGTPKPSSQVPLAAATLGSECPGLVAGARWYSGRGGLARYEAHALQISLFV